jgi:hypothetical protein
VSYIVLFRFLCFSLTLFRFFSPFVYNSVGRDNYKFFIGLLIIHPIAYIGFVLINFYYYLRTDHVSYLYYLFFVYSFLMFFGVGYLGLYHFKLINSSLTTNEDSNIHKYLYLQDDHGRYHNPFNMNKTSWVKFLEAIFPDQRLYYTRIEAIRGNI